MPEQIKNKWKYRIVFFVLSLFVMVLVMYLLIIPADSMTEPTACSLAEHIHTAECYALHSGNSESVLICHNEGEIVSHRHDSFCYADEYLICPLEEIEHVHDNSCFDENHVLSCGVAVHQHNENCYVVLSDGESAMVLTCGIAAHQHSDNCYESIQPPSTSAPSEIVSTPVSYPEDELYIPPSFSIADDAVPMAELTESSLILEYQKNISKIILSYASGDNWIEITSDTKDLPADAAYQFYFLYQNISVQDLIDAGGQMTYQGLPDWFQPQETGPMIYGGTEIIGTIHANGNMILITFYEDWLNAHKNDTISGDFKVEGSVDWHQLPGDGQVGSMPDLNIELHFEGDLSQKYGNIEIDKSEPELSSYNGAYYLRYTITVKSLEHIAIPNVKVKDVFSDASYISGYVGISEGMNEPPAYFPNESSDQTNFQPGEWYADNGNMIWDIGELQPDEIRTLTYYAEIAGSYVESLISNPIQNRAYVYSGEHFDFQKDDDTSTFRPKSEVNLQKEMTSSAIGEDGTGALTYSIIVSAPETNSFTLEGLALNDYFPEFLEAYLHGDQNHQITVSVDGVQQSIDFDDAAFELTFTIAPGQTVEIIYDIYTTNLFLLGNDSIELLNTASITKSGRTLASAVDIETIHQNTWMRKIYGSAIGNDLEIVFLPGEEVYVYQNGSPVKETDPPEGFTVPAGSHKYQVVLNENGVWDLSSTVMRDYFNSEYLKYTGYIEIQIFEKPLASTGNISDADLLSALEAAEPVKTVWLHAGGEGEFSFQPEQLGIDHEKYTYLLTYYASPNNVQDVGSVEMINHFSISGKVGYGDGWVTLPGITVSSKNVIQGGVNYNAKKTGWYYEPYPVYLTEAMRTGDYPERKSDNDDYTTQYANGAVYWIIRLEGDVGAGTCGASGSGNANRLGGFYIKDTPSGTQFNRDAVVGIYVASKDFDFTAYDTFADFEENNPGMNKLTGNPQNDKWFPKTAVTNPDYMWFADNADLNGIVFPKGYDLADDQALYIVLRTVPTQAVPTSPNSSVTYHNNLYIASGGVVPKVGEADYIYTVKASLFKESKGAYIYDQKNGTFTNCSNEKGGDWKPEEQIKPDMLPSSGTYTAWLLNVNRYGTMSGDAYVADFLPEGMELVYCDINNFGMTVKKTPDKCPGTAFIDELHGNPEWKEIILECSVPDYNKIYPTVERTVITYYNPTTRELRWHITGLQTGDANQYEINLRIICQVKDPELMLNGTGKTYINYAAIRDGEEYTEMESASVTINRKLDKYLDEEILATMGGKLQNGVYTGLLNQFPFKIEINPMGEDMCEGDILPALIDELSGHLLLIEDSISITDADGKAYTDFTYTVEEKDNHQLLIIKNLPDNTPLTIAYLARVDVVPNEPVTISNIAYWAGYAPPGQSQVNGMNFKYTPSGTAFLNGNPSVIISKVDADTHSKKLRGAVFELYAVDKNANPIGDALRTGTTDGSGTVTFDNQDTSLEKLQYNTVYCIKEITAPSGYKLDKTANCYYFIIINANQPIEPPEIAGLDVWYDSPEYNCTIENKKQTLSVEKIFLREDGTSYTPHSGCYRFGLFDSNSRLIETLTIEYTADGTANYYLDGVSKNEPEFTGYNPTSIYYVYELDDNGNPIRHDTSGTINGITFKVTYGEDGSNSVSIANPQITIQNQEKPIYLPQTGGLGVKKYTAVGSALLLLAMVLLSDHLILRKKRESRQEE